MKTSLTSLVYILLVHVIFMLCGCSEVRKKHYTLHVKGSESMHATFDALKVAFESIQDSIDVVIEGGGSKTGLVAIRNREAEIAMSSFPFNLDSVFGEGHGIKEQIVAYDGIVIITNKSNPLRQLTDRQVSDIFSGAIGNWSEIGGKPGQIIPVVRDENSGTQKFFTEYFGVDKIAQTALVVDENAEAVSKVTGFESGIGYVGFGYFTENINDILLRSLNGDAFIPPTFRHMHDGSYPLKRSLQIYYRNETNPAVDVFVEYLKTQAAQSIMEMHGLIPKAKMQSAL